MADRSPACCLCRSVTKSQHRTPGRLPAPHSRLPQDEEARTCGGFRTRGWGPHSASFVLLFRPVGGLPRESVCPGLAPVHGASRSAQSVRRGFLEAISSQGVAVGSTVAPKMFLS